jgi:DNA-binding response OmpR family regulator
MSLNVLIVDRDAAFASVLADHLGSDGHVVHVVDTGAAALAHGRKHAPDILLVDLSLPDTDGYALARRFRSTILTAYSAIFLVSDHDRANHKCDDDQVVDLQLTKPIEAELLSGLIHYVLNQRRSKLP